MPFQSHFRQRCYTKLSKKHSGDGGGGGWGEGKAVFSSSPTHKTVARRHSRLL